MPFLNRLRKIEQIEFLNTTITVVTPSYNQARFLEQTICSARGHPGVNLEYIVMDGGSNDGSIEIIKKYGSGLTYWVSQPDLGQADALNKGFTHGTGSIMGFLPSDDYYLPGVLHKVLLCFEESQADVVAGGFINLDETKNLSSIFLPSDVDIDKLPYLSSVLEPATFWRKEVWENHGPFKTKLHYTFGWDYLAEISTKYKIVPLPVPIVLNRVHGDRKTLDGSANRRKEILSHVKQFADPTWQERYRLVDALNIRRWRRVAGARPGILRPMLFRVCFPRESRIMTYEQASSVVHTLDPLVMG